MCFPCVGSYLSGIAQFRTYSAIMEHVDRNVRCHMNKTRMIIAATFAVLVAGAEASSKVTYRDSLGRQQGSATTDSRGQVTYRDSLGRKQGSSSTDRYGKTTYREAQGRITGTSTTDRYGKTTYRDAQGRIQGSKK